jgi:Uma2 family endonuclease
MARMGSVRPRVSFADLERAPEDGRRYELYDGEVLVVPSPLPYHQVVALNIVELLRRHTATRGGVTLAAPLDIVFSEYDVVQPDVVFFTARRRQLVEMDRAIRHAPDIAVEVLSPSTAATDRGRKMQMFARYGIPEYWIVDPAARTLEIFALGEGGYALATRATGWGEVHSSTLPDLRVELGQVFRVP